PLDDRIRLDLDGVTYELASVFETLGLSLGVTQWRGPVVGYAMLAGFAGGHVVALVPMLANVTNHTQASAARLDTTDRPGRQVCDARGLRGRACGRARPDAGERDQPHAGIRRTARHDRPSRPSSRTPLTR